MDHMKKSFKAILALLLVLVVASLVGCGKEVAKEDNHIKLGITDSESKIWNYIKEELAKEDIELEIVHFTDYSRPNRALADGDIDLNAFQHYAFFEGFIEDHNLDLTSIGETIIAPIGLYSNKIDDVSQVQKGDRISIPNDDTNGGRTLILLQTAGLITVDPEAGLLPTLKDITSNPLELEIIEVDAATTPRTIDDVTIATINSGFAIDAGYIPTEDSIFLEPVDENSKPYINIIAVRTEDKDNPIYKRVVEVYQTEAVKDLIFEEYKGSRTTPWSD